MAGKPLLQPRWVVIATYRNIPLPIKPIPPYKKLTKWPPAYVLRSKRASIVVNTDTDGATEAANSNSSPDGGDG